MSVCENIQSIQSHLPSTVRLIAVSKFQPIEKLEEAYQCGQRIFGENRVQEMCQKQILLPADIQWHFIGHLQKNKVKYITPFVAMIHSVDNAELLRIIDKEAEKNHRIIPCLLQVHIAQEETKFGFTPEGCLDFLSTGDWKNMSHIRIAGMMGMASFTEDTDKVRQEFTQLKNCFETAKAKFFQEENSFCELSMGMSEDYPIAIDCGSTFIRIGTYIFGHRNTL